MKSRGFTLIELLVVVAIIGVLSSIIFASTSSGRSKGRDAKLIADIKQLQNALDLYYLDTGRYPVSTNCGATAPNAGWCNSVESLLNDHWIKDDGLIALGPYISKDAYRSDQGAAPDWISSTSKTIFYFSNAYGGGGKWYMLVFSLENPNRALENTDGVTAADGTYFHYGNGTNGILTVGRGLR